MNADLYLAPQPEHNKPFDLIKDVAALEKHPELEAPAANKTKFLYYINKMTGVHRLYITPSVVLDVLAIVHREGHLDFAWCYEIINCS